MYTGRKADIQRRCLHEQLTGFFFLVMAELMLPTMLPHTSGERFIDKAGVTKAIVAYTASKIRIGSGLVTGKMGRQLAGCLA